MGNQRQAVGSGRRRLARRQNKKTWVNFSDRNLKLGLEPSPAFTMGMWWEIAIVGGIMVGIHHAGSILNGPIRGYGHAGRPFMKGYETDQQWQYHNRDRCHSYTTMLSKRRYMRHLNEGNVHYGYGL